jgi:hypothetical protein
MKTYDDRVYEVPPPVGSMLLTIMIRKHDLVCLIRRDPALRLLFPTALVWNCDVPADL